MHSSNKSIEMSDVHAANSKMTRLHVIAFMLACLLPFVMAWESIRVLFALILGNETFSQILLIPPVSLYLIYGKRKTIFSEVSSGWILGFALITPGIISLIAARFDSW